MKKRILVYRIAAITALLFCIWQNQCKCAEDTELPDVGTKPAQIVVIGSEPYITDMQSSVTPAHLRVVLNSVKPDIVAVDAPSNVIDSWKYAGLDITKVVKAWAEEKKIPLVPIGYQVADYNEQVEIMLQDIRKQGMVKEYKIAEDRLSSSQKAFRRSFKFINSADYDEIWRTYHKTMQRICKQSTPWQNWNQKIADKLIELGLEHPGKRIAVVINSPHCYYLKDSVMNQQGLKLLSIESSLDIDQRTLQENTVASDHLYALRVLMFDNFGQLPSDVLLQLETHLQRLNQYPEYSDDVDFFRGKMLLHRQNYQQAVRQFMPLTYLDSRKVLEFDGVTPIRDSAMIYSAIAKLEMGNTSRAMRDLFEITQMQDTLIETKSWANRIIQSVSSNNNIQMPANAAR